jgi:hypothetical protein
VPHEGGDTAASATDDAETAVVAPAASARAAATARARRAGRIRWRLITADLLRDRHDTAHR